MKIIHFVEMEFVRQLTEKRPPRALLIVALVPSLQPAIAEQMQIVATLKFVGQIVSV
jgi:hypothetical protein